MEKEALGKIKFFRSLPLWRILLFQLSPLSMKSTVPLLRSKARSWPGQIQLRIRSKRSTEITLDLESFHHQWLPLIEKVQGRGKKRVTPQ